MSDGKWLGAIACVALLGACGHGDGGTIDTSTGTYACNFPDPQNGDPVCREVSWGGGDYPTTQWVDDCMAHHGTGAEKCDREMALGGCQYSTQISYMGGTIFLTDTTWYYKGRLVTLMGSCPKETHTWVTPK